MDELVKMVAEETGLPEAQARTAAEAVVNFLKDKLPVSLASQIENLIDKPGTADTAQDLLKKGLDIFDKK